MIPYTYLLLRVSGLTTIKLVLLYGIMFLCMMRKNYGYSPLIHLYDI
jgi:hypothetical protein